MDYLNLCIDIGNTSSKAALYNNGKEVKYYSDFNALQLNDAILNYSCKVLVSKSGFNKELEGELQNLDYYNLLSYKLPLPIKLEYETPETLGADRIASSVAANALYPNTNLVILDLGTCLTLDFIDASGVFKGGLIAPGIQMRLDSMHEFTAALPKVNINTTVKFPGKSTDESMQVGSYQSVMYEIKGYLNWLTEQYLDLIIVDCSRERLHFDKEDNYKIFAHPNLVLLGLDIILNYNG